MLLSQAKYKLKVFQNLRIVLVGFQEEDQSQMEDLVHQNGGFVTTLEDQQATHVVRTYRPTVLAHNHQQRFSTYTIEVTVMLHSFQFGKKCLSN